jgi:hypothetical protein
MIEVHEGLGDQACLDLLLSIEGGVIRRARHPSCASFRPARFNLFGSEVAMIHTTTWEATCSSSLETVMEQLMPALTMGLGSQYPFLWVCKDGGSTLTGDVVHRG